MDLFAAENELRAWTSDELLYREFRLVRSGQFPLELFLEKYKGDEKNLGYVFHPESISKLHPETSFFREGRNISLRKHPRCFPLFFHAHTFFEMFYVYSGSCVQHFDTGTVTLSRGDLCLMAPNVTHGIEVNDDSIIINILIRASTFLDIFFNTIRDKSLISRFFLSSLYEQNKLNYIIFHTHEDDSVRRDILNMYIEDRLSDEYTDKICCSILTVLFAQLTRGYLDSVDMPESSVRHSVYEDEMINYIVQHYGDVTIESLAEHFHLSRQYCSRLIKESTGLTFSDLLQDIRLRQGEALLEFTSLSVEAISERLGYRNPETFIRAFKRKTGDTPGKFRTEKGHECS